MPYLSSRILSFGSAFPDRIVTNSEIEKRIGVPNGWIQERTGILERRFLSDGEQNSDLAAAACRIALTNAGKSIADVDLIIACTNSPDRWMPCLAAVTHAKLKAPTSCAVYDLVAACAGWTAGIQAADALVRVGACRSILVVGSEAMSRLVNWKDKTTCVLFGDGAGASLVGPAAEGDSGAILSMKLKAEGQLGDHLELPATGSQLPASIKVIEEGLQYLKMDGEEIFFHAVRNMSSICKEVLEENGLRISDIDWFVPHQANLWILRLVQERLGIPEEKVAINIDRFGNTTAATIPTCFDEYVRAGKIKPGHLVLVASFGGGLAWSGGLIRW